MNISGLGMLIVEYEMKSNQGKKKKDYLNVNYLTMSFHFIYFSHFLVIVWVENNIFYSNSVYIYIKKTLLIITVFATSVKDLSENE